MAVAAFIPSLFISLRADCPHVNARCVACECFHGIGLSSAGQLSKSSEEDVPLSKLHHREHAPATDNEADSNEEEISSADDSER